MSLRILIVDDEPLARARLRALVEELGHEVCAEAADSRSAELAIERATADVVLLDIEMPGSGGLTVGKRVSLRSPETAIIFVTAHPEHALKAFDAAAADYIVKPVRPERLAEALYRISQRRYRPSPEASQLRVSIGRSERIIPLNRISYFAAADGYVLATSHTLTGFVDSSLSNLESTFPTALIRAHRAYLAVKENITRLQLSEPDVYTLHFKGNPPPIPVSRRNLKRIRQWLRAL